MAWLKLTKKALYLMQSNSDKYLKKVALKPHNLAAEEYRLDVPKDWFQAVDAPRAMIVDIDDSQPEPQPAPKPPPVLDVYKQVLTAKAWGAVPRNSFPRTTPKYIVIHHTFHRNPPQDFSQRTLDGAKRLARSIQKDHIYGNGWSDSGHNFLNTTGGFLLEGRHGSLEAVMRGYSVRSAHARQDSSKLLPNGNSSPGIESEGNFTSAKMGQKQWNSLVALCAAICQSCRIDPNNIRGHRDFSYTKCPGDWLYAQLPRLRQEVRAKLLG